eukprot:gnl/MRDRNA2_/MRDRNA2_9645_c0_seq1.p2 gnl/MRDRNA2_/MRDRNA2_9645_c0~~gnl/MRDRNA2_/MRDRNA2_9645_c0_seq1.p2  ORF type:complete len:205 (+),score=27.34 gnl/MRDRNA2_/MRDRNA2_9645_c0_seq1:1-615(+)
MSVCCCKGLAKQKMSKATDERGIMLGDQDADQTGWPVSNMAAVVLNNGLDLLALDLWGHGSSDAPQGVEYNADLFVQQVEEVLAVLRLDKRKLVLHGFSMGCFISVKLALRRIDFLQQLILHSPWDQTMSPNLYNALVRIPFLASFLGCIIVRMFHECRSPPWVMTGLLLNIKACGRWVDLIEDLCKCVITAGSVRVCIVHGFF